MMATGSGVKNNNKKNNNKVSLKNMFHRHRQSGERDVIVHR